MDAVFVDHCVPWGRAIIISFPGNARGRPLNNLPCSRSGRTPRFEHRTAVGDGDGPRRGPGSASTSPAGPADLDGAAQQGTGLRRGPAAHGAGPGRGEIAVDGPSRSWPPGPALTARFVAGLAVELHRTSSSRPGSSGMDSLRRLPRLTPPPAAPHPLEDLQSARQEYLRTPPRTPAPTTRRALGRHHRAPARHRADPASAHAPLSFLERLRAHPRRTRPVTPGPGPHRATRAPAPATAPQISRAVSHEAPSPLRGHPR